MHIPPSRIPSVLVASAFVVLVAVSCVAPPLVTTVVQRVVVLADTATVYRLSGERRIYSPLGTAQKGDTLSSFATVAIQADTLERLFYVVYRGAEGWLYQGNGRFAKSEYDAVTSVCDTKFFVLPEHNEAAWQRAAEYVKRHSIRTLQTTSDALIETSARGKVESERDITFVIKRVQMPEGIYYTVKADGSFSNVNARKCAFYIQTGKDERDFQGVENVTTPASAARRK